MDLGRPQAQANNISTIKHVTMFNKLRVTIAWVFLEIEQKKIIRRPHSKTIQKT